MTPPTSSFDVLSFRSQFPFLQGYPEMAYLDSAASSLKPRCVIDRVSHFDSQEHSNIHRGVYRLSEEATERYEGVRKDVVRFLGASDPNEVVFTSNATDGLNFLAFGLAESCLHPGDEILLPISEHHSNIIPWMIAASRKQLRVKWIPLTSDNRIDMEAFQRLLTPQVKVVSLAHVSNVLGTTLPVRAMADLAHAAGAYVIVDGAQGACHGDPNISELGCDAYVFTGHKIFAPTGVGVVWARTSFLEKLTPFRGGGSMVASVSETGFSLRPVPQRFEAGTPPIAQVIGLGEALQFFQHFPLRAAHTHVKNLWELLHKHIEERFPFIRVLSPPGQDQVGIFSFTHQKIHPHDLGAMAGDRNVCVRVGHHCAEPLMRALGVSGCVRASPLFYSTEEDVMRLVDALSEAEKVFL